MSARVAQGHRSSNRSERTVRPVKVMTPHYRPPTAPGMKQTPREIAASLPTSGNTKPVVYYTRHGNAASSNAPRATPLRTSDERPRPATSGSMRPRKQGPLKVRINETSPPERPKTALGPGSGPAAGGMASSSAVQGRRKFESPSRIARTKHMAGGSWHKFNEQPDHPNRSSLLQHMSSSSALWIMSPEDEPESPQRRDVKGVMRPDSKIVRTSVRTVGNESSSLLWNDEHLGAGARPVTVATDRGETTAATQQYLYDFYCRDPPHLENDEEVEQQVKDRERKWARWRERMKPTELNDSLVWDESVPDEVRHEIMKKLVKEKTTIAHKKRMSEFKSSVVMTDPEPISSARSTESKLPPFALDEGDEPIPTPPPYDPEVPPFDMGYTDGLSEAAVGYQVEPPWDEDRSDVAQRLARETEKAKRLENIRQQRAVRRALRERMRADMAREKSEERKTPKPQPREYLSEDSPGRAARGSLTGQRQMDLGTHFAMVDEDIVVTSRVSTPGRASTPLNNEARQRIIREEHFELAGDDPRENVDAQRFQRAPAPLSSDAGVEKRPEKKQWKPGRQMLVDMVDAPSHDARETSLGRWAFGAAENDSIDPNFMYD